jgi:hypothetical protein
MKRCYIPFEPRSNVAARKFALIAECDRIASKWNADGYEMTLRQLYYQLVAAGIIPNNERSYKNLGNLVAAARDGGLIDWDHIVDRTRAMKANPHWASPAEIIEICGRTYAIDTRSDQPTYIEVWVEKEALAGIVGGVCSRLDVPRFSCRGYASATAMHDAGRRFKRKARRHGSLVILHLGDHDPSGLDMTDDIRKRVNLYSDDSGIEVRRIALTMAQVQALNLPPNPAKLSDVRAAKYVAQYGAESWELDALSPQYIENLIETEVGALTDYSLLVPRQDRERRERAELKALSDNYDDAISALPCDAPDEEDDDDDEE